MGRVAVEGAIDRDGFSLSGTAEIDIPLSVPGQYTEWVEVPVSYVANAAVCSTETAYTAAECGADAVVCATEVIADGVQCGWDYIQVGWCMVTGTCDRSPRSCSVRSCHIQCEVPRSCTRNELRQRSVTVPDVDLGRISGAMSVTVTEDGLFSVPELDFCPFGSACQAFDPTLFTVDEANVRLCGHVPGVGHHCVGLCDLPGVGELPEMQGRCDDDAAPAPAGLPIGVPVELRIADSGLALQTGGVQGFGTPTTLASCRGVDGELTCEWIIEPSPTREGAYYLRSPGSDLCLAMHGGNFPGAHGALHPCSYASDRADFQIRITPSPHIAGAFHVYSADGGHLLHAAGGSYVGARAVLGHCGGGGYTNCQWRITPKMPAAVPALRPSHVRASDAGLMMRGNAPVFGDVQTLSACAADDPRCQFVFEPSPTRREHYYLRRQGTDLCVHMHGGNWPGAYATLRTCVYENDAANFQFMVRPSPTRPGMVYIKAAETDLYLHAPYGNSGTSRLTLHPCPRGNDYPNCQFRLRGDVELSVPEGRSVPVKLGGTHLAMHAGQGRDFGALLTLADCSANPNRPECRFVFVPSPTRPEHYYLQSPGTDMCLTMHGGNWPGSYATLRTCDFAADRAHFQFQVERSSSRLGQVYIQAADSGLYLHAPDGNTAGSRLTLHACPKGNDHANCQWSL